MNEVLKKLFEDLLKAFEEGANGSNIQQSAYQPNSINKETKDGNTHTSDNQHNCINLDNTIEKQELGINEGKKQNGNLACSFRAGMQKNEKRHQATSI
jgi:hypothetical protein